MATIKNFKVKNGIDIGVNNGTAPITTNSTTVVTNLNADLLDGKHASELSPVIGSASITTVGTVTSGVWNAGIISATKGGTGVSTVEPIKFFGGQAQGAGPGSMSTPEFRSILPSDIPISTTKQRCVVATTTNLVCTSTATSLTNNGAKAPLSIDGKNIYVNDRVLVKDQSNQAQNGIYYVSNVGSSSINWVLNRVQDALNPLTICASTVGIESGNNNGGKTFITNFKNDGTAVIGTTSVIWYEVANTSMNVASSTKTTNISGGNNTTLKGSIPYQSNIDTTSLLLPNTSSTKKFLTETGDGTNGNSPSWDLITAEDLPNSVRLLIDCKVASVAALTKNTAISSIDGISISNSDRVLIKDQSNSTENGIYTNINSTNWLRATDADTSAELAGAFIKITTGFVNQNNTYMCKFNKTDIIGTTPITFVNVLNSENTRIGSSDGQTRAITINNVGESFSVYSHTHAAYAPISSPTLTGTPKAPTATTSTSSTQIATTAFATPRTGTTGATVIPSGTIAQRPSSPLNGYLRHNSESSSLEVYNNNIWESINDDSITAIAKGTLPTGAMVVLNSDGTVSSSQLEDSKKVMFKNGTLYSTSETIYDPVTNKLIILYSDANNSNKGTAIVGTVSGTSITFGTPVVFSGTNSIWAVSAAVSDNGEIAVSYSDASNSNKGTAIVGTVSGTSITFGTPVVFSTDNLDLTVMRFDSFNNKFIICYNHGGGTYLKAIVGTVSGTSITFGTPVTIVSGDPTGVSLTYDSFNKKVIVVYTGTAIVGTVSGTSITFGTPVAFADNVVYNNCVFDSYNNKVVVCYHDSDTGSLKSIVGTVSGTSITFGTPVHVATDHSYYKIIYSSVSNKVIICITGNRWTSGAIVGTVSGTSITFGDYSSFNISKNPFVVDNNFYDILHGAVYISVLDTFVVTFGDVTNNDKGTCIVGNIKDNSASFDSLMIGTPANPDANTNWLYTSTVFCKNSNKIVVSYLDQGSNSLKSVVGTVSGTSITFGTPVAFSGEVYPYGVSSVYDSFNDRVIVCNNSDRCVRVGTVSGTSITFGTPVVFSSNTVGKCFLTYDSFNKKVIVSYSDNSNNNKGTAIVGTVSGTSITFGTPVAFADNVVYNNCVFDSYNNKVVVCYHNGSLSSIVGTVSGTSITFGTPTIISNEPSNILRVVYDENSNKIVVGYTLSILSENFGRAIVGTVSGTSITFGTPVVFSGMSVSDITLSYNTHNNSIIFLFSMFTGVYAIESILNGGSITFGTPVVVRPQQYDVNPSHSYAYLSSCYDSNNDKIISMCVDRGDLTGICQTLDYYTSSNSIIGVVNDSYTTGETAVINLFNKPFSLTGAVKGQLYDNNYNRLSINNKYGVAIGVDNSKAVLLSNNLNRDEVKKATNGYMKIANGMIIQWGTVSSVPVNFQVIFPITFPNAALHIGIQVESTAHTVSYVDNVSNRTVNGFIGNWGTGNGYWIAIGY